MIDNSKKAAMLLAALKDAVPFKVELVPSLVNYLRAQNVSMANQTEHIVSDLSYAGDEGGIVRHMLRDDEGQALVVSLTQVRIPRTMPLACRSRQVSQSSSEKTEEARSRVHFPFHG